MATKSITKSIDINDEQAALELVEALEEAERLSKLTRPNKCDMIHIELIVRLEVVTPPYGERRNLRLLGPLRMVNWGRHLPPFF